MRVLSSTYGSRGDVEPLDFAQLLAGVGVPLVPVGRPWRDGARQAERCSSWPPGSSRRGADVLLRAMVATGLRSELMM